MLRKLGIIAELFSKFKFRNSEEFVRNAMRLTKEHDAEHRLLSWDYESMFTNVPFPFVRRVIEEHYHVITPETSVPVAIFTEILSFLIEDSCFSSLKASSTNSYEV